jgi:hypothetical protein
LIGGIIGGEGGFRMHARILPFRTAGSASGALVGTVHRDGSITYAGVTYPSIRQVPPECKALRVDVDTYVQWKSLYRAIDPKARRQ